MASEFASVKDLYESAPKLIDKNPRKLGNSYLESN